MLRHLLLLACTLPLLAVDALPPGTTVTDDAVPDTPGVISYTVTSAYQEGANKVEVLLPSRLDPAKRYPVVYCLPVNAGTKGDWGHPLTVAQEQGLADRHQTILVCPAYHRLPWYGDNPERLDMRQDQYLLDVVMPLIEQRHPAIAAREGRFLVGFSKSGLGALGLFLKNRDRFAAVAVFETWHGVPDDKQWNTWGFAECYGTRANFDRYDPMHLIPEQAKELAAEPCRIAVLNGGPGIRVGVEFLLDQLRDRKIPHTEIRNPFWGHTWTSGWLPFALTALNPQPR